MKHKLSLFFFLFKAGLYTFSSPTAAAYISEYDIAVCGAKFCQKPAYISVSISLQNVAMINFGLKQMFMF